MRIRTALAALPPLALAAAALAAPPLSVPIPRPTPEQEARMTADAEEARIREEVETPATPLPEPGRPESLGERRSETAANDVFRRDPFWPLAVTRARKADHDARVAARIEAERRAALIEKKRQEAIARGEDVELLDDDLDESGGSAAGPSGPEKRPTGSFSGATGEEWDAAFAMIPPRSGYLGGKRPALMLKGDKTPHYAGEKICVTNRNTVFTWRIASVDFRAYTHEIKRVSAKPLTPDSNQTP